MSKESQTSPDRLLRLVLGDPTSGSKVKDGLTGASAGGVIHGELDQYPDNRGGYDGIRVMAAAGFWRWSRWYFQDLARQLKPGGILVVEDPPFARKYGRGFAALAKRRLRSWFWGLAAASGCSSLQKFLMPAAILDQAAAWGLNMIALSEVSDPPGIGGRGVLFRKSEASTHEPEALDSHPLDRLFRRHFGEWGNPVLPSQQARTIDTAAGLLPNPVNSRVLVLSPHPDDELIGCGGTILGLAQAGAEIHVVQMTEGMSCFALRGECESIRRRIRWQEAAAVAERLGFTGHYWETRSPGGLEDSDETVARLLEMLAGLQPDLVLVPSATDRHPEHCLANRIFKRARGVVPASCRVLEYPVWGFLAEADVAVEVTAFHERVLDALYLYKTAMKAEDYVTRCRLLAGTYGELLLGSFNRPVELFRSFDCREGDGSG